MQSYTIFSIVFFVSAVELSFGAVNSHSDRGTWVSQLTAPPQIEDFDSYTSDVLVRETPVQLNGFKISASEGPLGDESNKIDAIPFAYNDSVNRTTDFFGDVNPGSSPLSPNNSTITILFDNPTLAWGAYFLGTEGTLIEIMDSGRQLLGSVSATSGVDSTGPIVEFVGFVLTDGMVAQSLLMTKGLPSGATNDAWAMDDVSFLSIPEPRSFSLGSLLLSTTLFIRQKH